MSERKKLFSITRDDLEWEYFRGSGKGGQNRNKRDTAVRVRHRESGAVAKAEDQRTRGQNRKIAFKRLTASDKFQTWLKIECARACGHLQDIDDAVEQAMRPHNLRIEIKDDGRWRQE